MRLATRSGVLPMAVLAFVLSACTVTYVIPENRTTVRWESSGAVITRFEVFDDRSVFRQGDLIAFVIQTSQSGYVSLTSLLPNGEVRLVAQNIWVQAGVPTLLDGSSMGSRFIVGPPEGMHRIRAVFTSGPVSQRSTLFEGRFGQDDWQAAVRIMIDPFPVWSVYETQFFVR